ncbi:Alkaline phosphatase [uncultured Candidatus Thioglobus sp.]|nr:Alkaline phosphatase [uncultured Candidatus Thioglobus sp.]
MVFSSLVLSLNVTSGVEQFNKDAHLDFGQEYNWNNTPQTFTRKDNQATKFLKKVGSIVRNTLGTTKLEDIRQLDSKITNDLKHQLTKEIKNELNNRTIGKAEILINKKANEYVNSFGDGKTEISIRQIDSKNPTYSIKTIQPLSGLSENSKNLTFFQGQLNSGENEGERRSTLNLGIGYRALLNKGKSIVGINLFGDYEAKSKHRRASIGLEYQTSKFTANLNRYFALSDKKVIGDYTEEALSGRDIKLIGQLPYLPWAKIKSTHYSWDGVSKPDIKGTIFGIELDVSPSTTLEIGTENTNTSERKTYANLSAQLPFEQGKSITNFKVDNQPSSDSDIVRLTDLTLVERSNKIRIEKILNTAKSVSAILGVFNAATQGATCTLYQGAVSDGNKITGGSGNTQANGQISFANVVIPTGLVSVNCTGGTYTDQATGQTIDPAPTLRAAKLYLGTGDLTLYASPLSEIAYQLADTANGNRQAIAFVIEDKNNEIATTFGIAGVDITSVVPTDVSSTSTNLCVAGDDNDDKFGLALAAVSQMSENAGHNVSEATTVEQGGDNMHVNQTIQEIATDIVAGRIVAIAEQDSDNQISVTQAIENFKNGTGVNNSPDDARNIAGCAIARISLGAVSGSTSEAGGTATFSIVLDTQPTADVTIALSSSDTTEGMVSTAPISFTTSDWNIAQTVTVTGENDEEEDGNIDYSISKIATSTDTRYNGISANTGMTNVDDDSSGITLGVISGNTSEAGATATFSITLNTQPSAAVAIALSSSDSTEGTISTMSISFTTSNWNTAQTITVTGQNDNIIGGSQGYRIIATPSDNTYVSASNTYAVGVINIDNNIPSVNNSETTVSLDEAGSATYTLTLNTQPTGEVTLTPSSADTGAAAVSTPLTFSTTNYNTAQTITVSGVDDADATDETVIISHSVSGADYDGVDISSVNVTTIVDDSINYPTVVIVAQTWTAVNMRHLADGAGVSTYQTNGVADSAADVIRYGKLYTWDAAMDGSTTEGAQGLCASGWHIPTHAEWDILIDEVGNDPATQVTQLRVGGLSGFNAEFAGFKADGGGFSQRGVRTPFWSSTKSIVELTNDPGARIMLLNSEIADNDRISAQFNFFSVRCLKDDGT